MFRLLNDDLKLPKKWGNEWTPESGEKKKYAGFWAGNICIEPCGPYATDEFESGVRAMFFAITFLPVESSKASAEALTARGIAHNGKKVYLSATDSHLSATNCGVCIMDVGREDRAKDNAAEAELQAQLASAQGGPLGLIGVEEILVFYTSEEGRGRWESLLEPAKPNADDLWKLGDSPAIRLVEHSTTGLAGIVWKVRSLSTATRVLNDKDMLGKVRDDQVQIAEEKIGGLIIMLRE